MSTRGGAGAVLFPYKWFFAQGAAAYLLTAGLVVTAQLFGAWDLEQGGYGLVAVLFLCSFAAVLALAATWRAHASEKLFASLVYFSLLFGGFTLGLRMLTLPAAFVQLAVSALLLFFSPRVLLQNLLLILALAGVSVQVGTQLPWQSVALLVVILCVYDVMAVSVTGSMIRLAREAVHHHLPVLFIFPERAKQLLAQAKQFKPGSPALFLGAGDILLPMLLFATLHDPFLWLMTLVGSLFGLGSLLWYFGYQQGRKPLPALPFVGGGAVLFLLFGKLLVWIL